MSEKKFTILSFVGGGIRGLMSVTILEQLYAHRPSILTATDLIAGCSTGSIITSQIVGGKTPQDLIELFTHGEITFYDKMNTDPTQPAYSIDEVLASQEALHGDRKIDDIGQKVLFVSFNVGGLAEANGIVVPTPWEPLMFTNMVAAEGSPPISGNADTPIAVAATSSGAMPGQLGSLNGNVDGAFFNHDPTIAAISLAVASGVKLDDIVAITIGTGLMPDWVASDTHAWGAQQWMNGDANPFDNTPPFLMNQSQPSPVLDMCLNGTSTSLMPMLAAMLLPGRYVNLNPPLPCFIPENSTSPQAIGLLQQQGAACDISSAIALLDGNWPDTLAVGASSGEPGATVQA